MYTLRDIVSNNVTLLNEFYLVDIDGIKSVVVKHEYGKTKTVTARIGLYAYLFSYSFKNIIRAKVKKDLGSGFIFKFGV